MAVYEEEGVPWVPYALCSTFWRKEGSLTYPRFFCLSTMEKHVEM